MDAITQFYLGKQVVEGGSFGTLKEYLELHPDRVTTYIKPPDVDLYRRRKSRERLNRLKANKPKHVQKAFTIRRSNARP